MSKITSKQLSTHLPNPSHPQIILHIKNQTIPYHQSYDTQPLTAWFKRLMHKEFQYIVTPDELYEAVRVEKSSLVYLGKDQSHKLYSFFTTSASEFRSIQHIHSESSEYMTKGYYPRPRLTMHRRYMKEFAIFEGSTYSELREFVLKERFSGTVQFSSQHNLAMHEESAPCLFLVCELVGEKGRKKKCAPNFVSVVNRTMQMEGFDRRMMHVWVGEEFFRRGGQFGFRGRGEELGLPYVVVVESRMGRYFSYVMPGGFSAGNLKEFVGGFLEKRSHHIEESEVSMDHRDAVLKVRGIFYVFSKLFMIQLYCSIYEFIDEG